MMREIIVPPNHMTIKNIISGAAIYDKITKKQLNQSNFYGFQTYNYSFEKIDGTTEIVHINEYESAMTAFDININHSPAGIRICNMKHILTFKDKEKGVAQFISLGGGACIGKTKRFVIVGVWNKNAKTSTGLPQNMEFCFQMVHKTVATLTKIGL